MIQLHRYSAADLQPSPVHYLDDLRAGWGALFHLGRVGGAVVEEGLVVVDVGDEHHHQGGAGVRGERPLLAARAVVPRRHVQLVLVLVQLDVAADQPDHACAQDIYDMD